MSATRTNATWLVLVLFGVTAAVIFRPLAAAATTYSQHCEGEEVSVVDSATTTTACGTGTAGPCAATSVFKPEFDWLDSVGTLVISGTTVTGNALSVSVSQNDDQTAGGKATNDNQFVNPFGITLTGTLSTPSGTPAGCFRVDEKGSIPSPPVKFATTGFGCYSNNKNEFDLNLTKTSVTFGTATFTLPINLHCHGANQSAY